MKEVMTKTGEKFIVDDENYEKALEYKWLYMHRSMGAKFIVTRVGKKYELYARVVLGSTAKYFVCANGNRLDLRKENIIECYTDSEHIKAINTFKKK